MGTAVVAVLLVAGALGAVVARAAPALSASTPTPLLQDPPDTQQPLSGGPAVSFVVDAVRGHLFASTLYPVSTVMVTDMDGALVTTLPDEAGASGMAISPDGATLYVALSAADAISVIDLATLTELRRIPTGAASCPTWLATAGNRLWVSYGCSYNTAAIVSVDPAPPSLALPPAPDDRYYMPPRIASASPTASVLVASIGSAFSSTLDRYDVSSAVAVRTRTLHSDQMLYGQALAVSPDGATIFVNATDTSARLASGGLASYAMADLSTRGFYRTCPFPQGVAVSPDGTHLAVSCDGMYTNDVWVFPVGVFTPTHARDYPVLGSPGPPIAYSPDGSKLFLYRRTSDNSPSMSVVHGVSVDPARVTVTAPASSTLTGALRFTDGTSSAAGLTIAVTRSGPDGRRALPSRTTGPGGAFSLTDTPTAPGGYTYRFTWAGDATHPPASASASVRVTGTTAPPVLPPPPAGALSVHDLGVARFGALAVDEPHRHLFVSDPVSGVVAVTDLDGNRVGTIGSLPGAAGLALSHDSTTLFVALSTANAVAAVDAADLVEVGRWRTSPLAEVPYNLAEAGNQVFFGYGDRLDSGGGWGSFNLNAPDDVFIWDHAFGPVNTAVFATAASDPNVLIAGGYTGQTGTYDVSTTPPTEKAYDFELPGTPDRHLSDDGSLLVLGGKAAVDAATLIPRRNPFYPDGMDIGYAGAITSDGAFVAGGADVGDGKTAVVRIWPIGGAAPLRLIPLVGQVVHQGMAFTHDASRLYVVTAADSDYADHPSLQVLHYPTTPKAVAATGWNGVGQLGLGTTADAHIPTAFPSGAVSVAAGAYHSLALATDGSVWAWGWNALGQLGDGTTTDRSKPVRVTGLTDVVAIAAGVADSFAVKRDGTVWAWGWNASRQLGDGTTTDRHTPARVPGLPAIASVSAGAYHTLALGQDGRVWSWGWNGVGQLGDGTTTDHFQPAVVPGLDHVVSIAAGWLHSLAARTDDLEPWAWGWNAVGQLGDGTTVDRHAPVRLNIAAHITSVAAGAYHSLAGTMEGGVWAWGWNAVGQLGDSTTVDRHLAVEVPGVHGVTSLSAGIAHSLAAVRLDTGNGAGAGAVAAWGWNASGQLGDGTTVDRHTPVAAIGPSAPTAVAAGGMHTLAI